MKLMIIILLTQDSTEVSKALIAKGFGVTRIASTGGFLWKGSTTLLSGVEDGKVNEVVQIIREKCNPPVDPGHKRATIFVLNVDEFIQA